MEKYCLDKDWKFHKGDIALSDIHTHTECYMAAKAGGATGPGAPDYDRSDWITVDLPHDFAVENEFDEKYGPAAGYKARGKGWCSKSFRLDDSFRDKRLILNFGGVASSCVVYFNGSIVGRNFSCYNSFFMDITDMALFGERLNTIVVYVDADIIEGWWYEGAGIYRHVDLLVSSLCSVAHNGIFVHPTKSGDDTWSTDCDTTVQNDTPDSKSLVLKTTVLDSNGNEVVFEKTGFKIKEYDSLVISQSPKITNPSLWDISSPVLYTLKTELSEDGAVLDTVYTKFGYRTISIDKDKGFFLNGRRVTLYGTCNHQDHAGVGVAVPDSINEYRIKLLKEMGSNAYRCSHGNPTPELLDYCDRYGILVMDENRWFSTSEDCLGQLRSMVIRDRNHPSVIMYSLFNEEPLQGTPTGKRLAIRMRNEVKRLDDTRFLVGAMNNGVTNDDGACNVLDMTGFNYITHTYDEFREKYPDIPMLGSENDSAFQTRGVYKTDHSKNIIDCYDSEAAPWGNTYADGFKQIDIRPHIMGMFIWTGFDYRGEPTPFEWPSISTQFGIMDTCGFKKDAFYQNKAYFTDKPMIHVLPHWNWTDNEDVRVKVCTNCTEAEIFINGKSMGRQPVDKYEFCDWNVEFEKGTLKAVGYIDGTVQCEDEVKTAGEPCKIVLEPHKAALYKYCADAVAINVSVTDNSGIHVPTAQNLIKFKLEGGTILGVGNGDPNSHEADKADTRHLFNGFCQVIAEPYTDSEEMALTAVSDELESASVAVKVNVCGNEKKYINSVNEKYVSTWRTNVELFSEKPDPCVVIEDHDMNNWPVAKVGSGNDERFNNHRGFALYRTSIHTAANDSVLEFRDLAGDYIEVYLNSKNVFAGKLGWQEVKDFDIEPNTDYEVTVIIESKTDEEPAGITKPVVIM